MNKSFLEHWSLVGLIIGILIVGGVLYYVSRPPDLAYHSIEATLNNQTSTSTSLSNATSSPVPKYSYLLPIQLTQPSTNTKWVVGKTYLILWTAATPWGASGRDSNMDDGSFVLQLLSSDIATPVTIASASPAHFLTSVGIGDLFDKFQYSYTVPSSVSDGKYTLVIIQSLNTAKTTAKQTVFIASSPAIYLDVPATISQGQLFKVTWLAPPAAQTVSLDLMRNNQLISHIASQIPNTRSYVWAVPEDANYGNGFQIQITVAGYPPVPSDNFSIIAGRG